MKVLGLISGTSFDAIEVAAAELRLERADLVLRPLGSRGVPYEPELRSEIGRALPPAGVGAGEICHLDTLIGRAFAHAAKEAAEDLCGGQADLVVSHGQTVFHWVEGNRALGTLQLGQPAWISEETGSPTVSDLRSRDIAAGGHGAPLVSLFDVLLLGCGEKTCAALNLGGIANVTLIPPEDPPLAFDTGPANALMDAAISYLTGGTEHHDEGGRHAGRGKVHEALLDALLEDPYYELPPPKSTGKERFNLPYLLERIEPFGEIAADDLLATLAALTAKTVADALKRHSAQEVIVSGGGTRNPALMKMLDEAAPGVKLRPIDDLGIPSGAKEAYAFAVLGFLTANGLPGAVPSCTGARRAAILGSITPGSGPLVLPTPAEKEPVRIRLEFERTEAS